MFKVVIKKQTCRETNCKTLESCLSCKTQYIVSIRKVCALYMFFYKEETTSIIGFTHGTLCRISTMRIEIQVAEVL